MVEKTSLDIKRIYLDFLSGKNQIDSLEEHKLYQWIERYPYYAPFWFLLSKKNRFKPLGDVLLSKASVLAKDRCILRSFYFTTSQLQETKPSSSEKSFYTIDRPYLNKKEEDISIYDKADGKEKPVKDWTEETAIQAQKSVQRDVHLVSSTLANLLFIQKKYLEARQAYEYLILKYPEKSTFFAEEIKKIDCKLNSKQ